MTERPYEPNEADVAFAREEHMELRLHTAMPGRIQSYNPDLQVADVVPLIRQQVPKADGTYDMEDLPIIPHVSVCFPRMGSWFLSLPVSAGDTGLILCCESAIGHWWAGNGDVTDPGDLRRFHLAHAVFLPLGLAPRPRKLTQTGAAGADGDGKPTGLVLGSDVANGPRIMQRADGAVEIATGGTVAVRVDPDGTVHLGAAAGASFVALASLVTTQLTALKAAITSAGVVPNDGGAAFKAAILASLASWPGDVAATRVKAT